MNYYTSKEMLEAFEAGQKSMRIYTPKTVTGTPIMAVLQVQLTGDNWLKKFNIDRKQEILKSFEK